MDFGATPTSRSKNKVLLVDSHPVLRNALRQYLNTQPDWVVCAEAETTAQAIEAAEIFRPDLIITDVFLDEENTASMISSITSRFPNMRVMVFSLHDERVFSDMMDQAGADGYLSKTEPPAILLFQIRRFFSEPPPARDEVFMAGWKKGLA